MREDFIAFKNFYHDKICHIPSDSFYYQAINHKFVHSIEVLHFGQKILTQTPELKHQPPSFKRDAERALLFHDVGRFEENLRRYNASIKNNPTPVTKNYYDHCLLGYNMLKNNPHYNNKKILFAIRYHGKRIENIHTSVAWKKIEELPETEAIKNIFYLVRDADKLANLRSIKTDNHLTKDIFYKQLSNEALHAPISSAVKKQFMAGKTVSYASLYSFSDRILMILSWIYDLHFQTSKKIFKQEKYADFLIAQLAQYHHHPDDINAIKKRIKQI